MTVENLLSVVVDACDEKHGYDIVAYDVKNSSMLYDYCVICHAPTSRQVEAIANEVKEKVNDNGGKIYSIEGIREANWVLLDLGDIIVNIMTRTDREYYALDNLFEKYPIKEV